jgi:hypothetical protein
MKRADLDKPTKLESPTEKCKLTFSSMKKLSLLCIIIREMDNSPLRGASELSCYNTRHEQVL